MEDNLIEALKLLVVGMCTVFVVLMIIIEGGKLLIKAVNKFMPEEDTKSAPTEAQPVVSPAVSKAIIEAVNQATGGQAEVIEIKKA